jgi:hypothetical protein
MQAFLPVVSVSFFYRREAGGSLSGAAAPSPASAMPGQSLPPSPDGLVMITLRFAAAAP